LVTDCDRPYEPIEGTASKATVSGDALSAAGFSESGVEEVRVNRSGTLSISGDVEMDLGYRIRAVAIASGDASAWTTFRRLFGSLNH
jgi:hypothetical protein